MRKLSLLHNAGRLALAAASLLLAFGPAQAAAHLTAASPAPGINCFIDTTQANFEAGSASAVNTAASPGSVILGNVPAAPDQGYTGEGGNAGMSRDIPYSIGQSFTPAVSGRLTQVDISVYCSECNSPISNLIARVYATSGGAPTGAPLAVATVSNVSPSYHTVVPAVFDAPPLLTAGTQYAVTFLPTVSDYFQFKNAFTDPYSGGTTLTGFDNETNWRMDSDQDLYFQTYMIPSDIYVASGWLASAAKDVTDAAGQPAPWLSLAWNAATPANTALKFQLAGSSNLAGPFNFVGPDGTASSYFSVSGAALPAQLASQRYLKWKAYLSATDNHATPSLEDVSLCFNNTPALAVSQASGAYSGTVSLAATLTAGGSPLVGLPVEFSLHGAPVGAAATNSAGVAVVSNVPLNALEPGVYSDDVTAAFAGDSIFYAASGSASLTVTKAPVTVSLSGLSAVYDGTPKAASAAPAVPGLAVSVTYNGSAAAPTGAGRYNVTATVQDAHYQGNVAGELVIAQAEASITITPYGVVYDGLAHTATGTAHGVESTPADLSGLLNLSATTHTNAGSYPSDAWSFAGNVNYKPAQGTLTNTIAKAGQVITFAALPDRRLNSPDFTLDASASSGQAVSYTADGACTVAGSLVHLSAVGVCSLTALQPGSANYAAAPQVSQSFTVLPVVIYLPVIWR